MTVEELNCVRLECVSGQWRVSVGAETGKAGFFKWRRLASYSSEAPARALFAAEARARGGRG